MSLFDESEEIEKKSFDNFFLGFFLSSLLTMVMLPMVSRMRINFEDILGSYKAIFENPMFVNFMIVSLFPTMVLFFLFYKTERWQSAKGLIVSIVLCVVSMILIPEFQ